MPGTTWMPTTEECRKHAPFYALKIVDGGPICNVEIRNEAKLQGYPVFWTDEQLATETMPDDDTARCMFCRIGQQPIVQEYIEMCIPEEDDPEEAQTLATEVRTVTCPNQLNHNHHDFLDDIRLIPDFDTSYTAHGAFEIADNPPPACEADDTPRCVPKLIPNPAP